MEEREGNSLLDGEGRRGRPGEKEHFIAGDAGGLGTFFFFFFCLSTHNVYFGLLFREVLVASKKAQIDFDVRSCFLTSGISTEGFGPQRFRSVDDIRRS